ncbi:integrin alpha pat-2 [Streptomyces sp. NPDC099050]|uniref:integrin alpha pat-2 n=1 Tax=Streptomyces sp. NPDC099050 TaxID=3366100 RepID=UPI003802EF29
MRKQSLTLAALCAATVIGLTTPVAATAAPTAAPAGSADFNGDGYPDLAVSANAVTVAGRERAGALSIQYGSPTGLQKPVVITKDTPGVPGLPATYGRFGTPSSHGDVDGDGYTDLLVEGGSDAENRSTGILVLRGSEDGITGRYTGVLSYGAYTSGGTSVVPYKPQVGDVTGDGIADIVTQSNDGGKQGIAVLQGPLDPATNEPAKVLYRDTQTLDGIYGSNLHVGDMTGDGIADIVASSYDKGVLLKGTPGGLVPAGSVLGSCDDRAFGDLNKDGYQDFACSDSGMHTRGDGGGFTVTYGSSTGISTTLPVRYYNQDTAGVPGTAEVGDFFGNAVAIGDTDQDGYGDLLIGASSETGTDPEATFRAGAVTVLRGSATGVTTTGAKTLTQDSAGVPSTSEKEDHFGSALSVIDTDKDGKPEVYVGGYGEDGYAGRVWKLKTDAGGVTGTGATSFNLTDLGGPARRAYFGWLTAG